MLDKFTSNVAGNLFEELEEIQKMIPNEETVETAGTSTERCSAFLTIYCC